MSEGNEIKGLTVAPMSQQAINALAGCIDLFETWRDGIFASIGITWESEPPAISTAREVAAKLKMGARIVLVLVITASGLSAAEPAKSLDQLLAHRAAVQGVIEKINAEWEANRAEFLKMPATKVFNEKQAKLQQAYKESETRLKELDSLIASQVAKERKP